MNKVDSINRNVEYKLRCLKAIEKYYKNFGNGKSLSSYARDFGVNPVHVHRLVAGSSYLGQPDNKREARSYLSNLRKFL